MGGDVAADIGEFPKFIERSNIGPKLQGAISGMTGGISQQARIAVDPDGALNPDQFKFDEGFGGLDFQGDNNLPRNEEDLPALLADNPVLVERILMGEGQAR